MSRQEIVDFKKLTTKEMLILLAERQAASTTHLEKIEKRLDQKDDADRTMLIDLTIVKTKVMLYGMLGGGIVTLVSFVLQEIIF